MIKRILEKLNEYTEEPDAFETQTEREMEQEYLSSLDKEWKDSEEKKEKEKNKYITQLTCMLDNIKKKINFDYYRNGKHFRLYFDNKGDYNTFMAQEKHSKRFNDCIEYYNDSLSFEKLGKDDGRRYLSIRVK